MSLLHRPTVLEVFPPRYSRRPEFAHVEITWLVGRAAVRRLLAERFPPVQPVQGRPLADHPIARTGGDCRLEMRLELAESGSRGEQTVREVSVECLDPGAGERLVMLPRFAARGCVRADDRGWVHVCVAASRANVGASAGSLLRSGSARAGDDAGEVLLADGVVPGPGTPHSAGLVYIRSGLLSELGLPGGRYELDGVRIGSRG